MASLPLGNTTLLLFTLGLTSTDSVVPDRGTIPGHGPSSNILEVLAKTGSGSGAGLTTDGSHLKQHFAFAVAKPEDVKAWEKRLEEQGVRILSTMDWERGGRSVYFEDLDGAVGEVASRGLWKHW